MANSAFEQLRLAAVDVGFAWEELTTAEQWLFEGTATGEWMDCSELAAEEKTVRADRFEWLLTSPAAADCLHHKGVRLVGATFPEGFDLEDAEVKVPLSLFKCVVQQLIMLRNSRLRNLALISCLVKGKDSEAINADGAQVESNVYLRNGFEAVGEVNFQGSKIGGCLDLGAAKLSNLDGRALNADSLQLSMTAFLRKGFEAVGEVNFVRAAIGGNLEFDTAYLSNPKGYALNANGLQLSGSAFLRQEFVANGAVDLSGSFIGSQMQLHGGIFDQCYGRAAIDLTNAEIRGGLGFTHMWHGTPSAAIEGTVLLRNARAGQLHDSPEVWRADESWRSVPVGMAGFTYDALGVHAEVDPEFRKKWLLLGKQVEGDFSTQPYTQLARVLSSMGRDYLATDILMEREWQRIERGGLPWHQKSWRTVMGMFLGHGYKPWRGLIPLLVLFVVGWLAFANGFRQKQFVPAVPLVYLMTDEIEGGGEAREIEFRQRHRPPYDSLTGKDRVPQYPAFNALVYSIDTLLPIVDLHQEGYWMPYGRLRVYLWIHIGLGWVFTTLFVVGLTGVVRRGHEG